jgi:organic radical activating enzyme
MQEGKMVKHIQTKECPRTCGYCISKKVTHNEADWDTVIQNLPGIYRKLSISHKSIMHTGGEPCDSKHFPYYLKLARHYFEKCFITTQDDFILSWQQASYFFDAIIFSLHDLKTWRYIVKNNALVYASILPHLYNEHLPNRLKELGFAGLTINEDHFGKDIFDQSQLPVIEDFSIKINRRGQCFNQDTIYIMPDLSIHQNFDEFL